MYLGVLQKDQVWIEQHYQSPQEIAQHQLIERKKLKENDKKD